MFQSQKYLGIGVQRKGQRLPDINIGWFIYQKTTAGLMLEFDADDFSSTGPGIDHLYELIRDADAFWCFYSGRGRGYYIQTEYQREYGLPREEKGQLQLYDEEAPSDNDTTYTRLAWDVQSLRTVELEWPRKELVMESHFREQLRESEINDEPGRGPIKRLLQETQQEMEIEIVPAAAMAFQALRKAFFRWDGEEKSDVGDPQYVYSTNRAEFIDYEARRH